MKNNFFVSTTNNVENGTIKKYLDVVSANVVVGTHFFSDFAASFTDVFGGRSNTYQSKLQLVYDEAVKEIQRNAKEIGANGIVGLKMDVGELSGKGKSMLMVSAIGTAVLISFNETTKQTIKDGDRIRVNELQAEIKKRAIIKKVRQEKFKLDESDWEHLLSHDTNEIIGELLVAYCEGGYYDYNTAQTISYGVSEDRILQYLSAIDKDIVEQKLYEMAVSGHNVILDLIKNLNLFSANRVLALIDSGNIGTAISLLSANQSYYDEKDIQDYRKILDKLNNLPDTGEIKKKKGLISKEKDIYCCTNGHENSIDNTFCNTCNIDIKGLNIHEVKSIKQFEEKVSALSSLFK
jgi:uncharacterized protein YbjQ (UPF0145 family)